VQRLYFIAFNDIKPNIFERVDGL